MCEETLAHQLVEAHARHLLEDGGHDPVVQVGVFEKGTRSPVRALFIDLESLIEVRIGGIECFL